MQKSRLHLGRHAWPLVAISLTLAATAGAGVAGPVRPSPDVRYLEESFTRLDALQLPDGAAAPPAEVLAGVRSLLRVHAEAVASLAALHPLSSVTGIESQDRYEHRIVQRLVQLVLPALATAPSRPSDQDILTFSALVPEPLPLGKTPVGFMVLHRVRDAVNAADLLGADPTESQDAIAQLALRYMAEPIELYRAAHEDLQSESQASEFRHQAVITRLRCPKDDATYRILAQKNKWEADGSITRIYSLQCNLCAEPLDLQFPLEFLSRLEQIRETQALKKPPKPHRPSGGLDP